MDASGRDSRPSSWTARILAPLVLAAVVAAIVLVVSGSLGSDDENEAKRGSQGQSNTSGCSDEAERALKDGYYVVQADDVEGLSGIATKTCTTVDELERLNPNLDPQALQVQNCVDLIPDGCKKLSG